MSLKPWKKISEEVIHENPWWKYSKGRFMLPKGDEADYYFVDVKDSVMIVGVDDDGKIPMVKQYRPLMSREPLEFPSGSIEKGQTPEEAADDEFASEAKLSSKKFELLGKIAPSTGVMRYYVNVFVCTDLFKKDIPEDPNEEFERMRLTPDEIEEKIKQGEIFDGITISTWHLAKSRVLEIIKNK